MSDDPAKDLTINLTSDEALVLFDWLARFEGEQPPALDDQAEQIVLWNVEAVLEKALVEPLKPDYVELLARARERVRAGYEE